MLEKKANVLLKPYEITHGYTYFLMELYRCDGLTQTQLQRAIGIEQPTVVRTLDRMERDGFIVRKASATDRRVFNIYLTEKGKSCEPKVLTAARILNQSLLETFSKDEEKIIQSFLQKLIDNLESEN